MINLGGWLILILSIPAGFLIAWLARDELVDGKRWFKIVSSVFAILSVAFFAAGFDYIALTCLFIAIVAYISFLKSSDKKWTRR